MGAATMYGRIGFGFVVVSLVAALIAYWHGNGHHALQRSDKQLGSIASNQIDQSAMDRSSNSQTPAIPNSTAAVKSVTSKVPWAAGMRAFERRDFATLAAAARTSPSTGSYALAARALSVCSNVLEGNTKMKREIDASTENKAARMSALDALRQSCEGRFIAETLALEDAQAFSALRPLLTEKGATFDGAAIPEKDRGAFGAALQMALCTQYGQCMGPGSTGSHIDCALHGECEYMDSMRAAQNALPPWLYERAGVYYSRVANRLQQRQFSAFGAP
jgi:hypothetical protein